MTPRTSNDNLLLTAGSAGGQESRGRLSRPGPLWLMFIVALVSSGCAHMGPELLANGRPAYNRSIADTDNQQMLMIAIRDRYHERGSLLAVSSITANVTLRADARIEAGIGDQDDYRGNLVPFSGGLVYEENPTITYTPVDGQSYIRALTSPIHLGGLAALTRAVVNPGEIYMSLVSSVNGIYNPDFPLSAEDVDPRFDRFVEIMAELHRAHRLDWIENPDKAGQFSLVIDGFRPRFTDRVEELFGLLGLAPPEQGLDQLVVPVLPYSHVGAVDGIRIKTRSVYKLVEIFSACIEVPAGDEAGGVAAVYPRPGPVGKGVRVRYSEDAPEDAYVAVNYRDGWFYIEDSDIVTKGFFRILGSLWGVTIAETASKSATPVLTVPVSR